jgi:sortase (surface protein transpeptidase)
MTATAGRRSLAKFQKLGWTVCAIAIIVAVGSFVGAAASKGPTAAVSSSSPTTTRGDAIVNAASARRSIPRRLSIPSIDVNAGIGVVGLQSNDQVEVPPNTRVVSWFRYGPTPGQPGSSVILGHVDSYVGPGVFFRLRDLKAGASIQVILADDVTATFRVIKVVQYSKTDFPDRLVYGPHGGRLLNLVTCGGVFDHATGHYESNIVVFSRLVRATRVPAI